MTEEIEKLQQEMRDAEIKQKEAYRRLVEAQNKAKGVEEQDLVGKCYREGNGHYLFISSVTSGTARVFEFHGYRENDAREESGSFFWMERPCHEFSQYSEYVKVSREEFLKNFDETLSHLQALRRAFGGWEHTQ